MIQNVLEEKELAIKEMKKLQKESKTKARIISGLILVMTTIIVANADLRRKMRNV